METYTVGCGYSLEVPQRGTFNEYPQHMFSSRNKKNIDTFWLKKAPYQELWLGYCINLKYWDTLTPFHTCLKILNKTIALPIYVSKKKLLDEWQTVQTLIRCPILWCLIFVYTVCTGLSVPIFRVITLN